MIWIHPPIIKQAAPRKRRRGPLPPCNYTLLSADPGGVAWDTAAGAAGQLSPVHAACRVRTFEGAEVGRWWVGGKARHSLGSIQVNDMRVFPTYNRGMLRQCSAFRGSTSCSWATRSAGKLVNGYMLVLLISVLLTLPHINICRYIHPGTNTSGS